MRVTSFRWFNSGNSKRSLCKTFFGQLDSVAILWSVQCVKAISSLYCTGLATTSLWPELNVLRCEALFQTCPLWEPILLGRLKAWVVEQLSSPIKAILSLSFEDDNAKPQSPACKQEAVFPAAERNLSCSIDKFVLACCFCKSCQAPGQGEENYLWPRDSANWLRKEVTLWSTEPSRFIKTQRRGKDRRRKDPWRKCRLDLLRCEALKNIHFNYSILFAAFNQCLHPPIYNILSTLFGKNTKWIKEWRNHDAVDCTG